MNLYLLSQSVNKGYDTFDSCVVAAESINAAKRIHPFGDGRAAGDDGKFRDILETWARHVDEVECRHIGQATDGIQEGVICGSFNAG